MNRSWLKLASFALAAALIAPQIGGQAGPPKLTPAELTLKKSIGSPSAPVTLEIFSDYQCPDCKRMHMETTRRVIDNYVATGKVYLVHRDFPLTLHMYSRQAARWLNAAAAAGGTQLYQATENALYAKQEEWGATGRIEQSLAGSLPAADMNKIRAMEQAQRAQLDAIVQSDVNLGNARNLSGTPAIFTIHKGQTTLVSTGSVTYALLKQYLDYLLAH